MKMVRTGLVNHGSSHLRQRPTALNDVNHCAECVVKRSVDYLAAAHLTNKITRTLLQVVETNGEKMCNLCKRNRQTDGDDD